MQASIRQAADLLRRSSSTVALTGAGMSTPSGIPDFRSPDAGLWTLYDPLEVASLWAFHDHPEVFYRWVLPLINKMQSARPNEAHRVLASMEKAGRLVSIITQNIDSLHQRAGSCKVREIHGHTRSATCLSCGHEFAADPLWAQILAGGPPPRCPDCDGLLKPNVILFGEPLPYETLSSAQQDALTCDVMLVAGTSLEVMPAADLPLLARRRGGRLIFVNREPTVLDAQADVVIRADVVDGLEALWRSLGG